jgi:small-conductance mechanosensitive channel
MNFLEHLAPIIKRLDSIGFDYGNTRISLYRALMTIIVVIAVFVIARLASIGVRRLFRRITRLDATEQLLGEKLVGIVVWIVCILVGVDILGIDLTALTVFSGAFGLAIGFGLQKTFGNLLAGIILLMDRSIKPGDVIAVSGQGGSPSTVGQVKRIGIRAVSVITRDRIEFLIPNENLMINQVENWSYSSRDVRLKVPVSVAYGTDIAFAEELMLRAAHESPRVLQHPEPSVWMTAYGDNALMFEIQIWIDDPEAGIGDVRSDVLKRLWHIFKENGVRVPYPQHDVHVKEWPEQLAKMQPPTKTKPPAKS